MEGDRKVLEEFEHFFDVIAIRDESQIVRELGKGLSFLNFSPIVERAFLRYYLNKYIWQMRIAAFLTVLLYAVFGILDLIVFPEVAL
ncbi:MAG: hypothetical protein Q9N34_05195 [Aquificota bacterium]|nr:hypothetical protein [Aquificota bacterium]